MNALILASEAVLVVSDVLYWTHCAWTAAVWREVGAIVLEVSGAIVALTILSMLVRRKRI